MGAYEINTVDRIDNEKSTLTIIFCLYLTEANQHTTLS